MLDHGPSVARISSTNESTSENITHAKADTAAVSSADVTDTASADAAKIPNANKWTVSIMNICEFLQIEMGLSEITEISREWHYFFYTIFVCMWQ